MEALTNAQRDALTKIHNGKPVPITTGIQLRDKGLAQKADLPSGQRGYMRMDLTDAGQAALGDA